MSRVALLGLFSESHIEAMREFDLKLLDRRSYGLGRDYPVCPNYSDNLTVKIIERYLTELDRAQNKAKP